MIWVEARLEEVKLEELADCKSSTWEIIVAPNEDFWNGKNEQIQEILRKSKLK